MREIKRKQFWLFLPGVLALLAMHDVAAASPGTAAYQAQHYQEAFSLLTAEAKGGEREAQYLLGTLYLDGLGVTPSPTDAVIWLKHASDQRHPIAAQMLGKLYMSGMGVPIDIDKGIRYMELADQFTPDEDEEECD